MEDFKDVPTQHPNAVVVGLAQEVLDYQHLNEAFRLLTNEHGKNHVPLIVTHKANYIRDDDDQMSLGPGAVHSIYLVDMIMSLTFAFAKQAVSSHCWRRQAK